MSLTKTVKFLQKTAIIHDNKVLILKRSENSPFRPGAWDLPGGNAEWPEADRSITDPHRQEVAREIKEETGFRIDPGIFTDKNLVHFTTYFEADVPRYAFICGWRTQLSADFNPNSVAISSEHTDWAWVSLEELETYDFGEPVGTYVKTIIRNALKD